MKKKTKKVVTKTKRQILKEYDAKWAKKLMVANDKIATLEKRILEDERMLNRQSQSLEIVKKENMRLSFLLRSKEQKGTGW